MPFVKKTCQICGKQYNLCRDALRNSDIFHWQEVACSTECAAEYLKRMTEETVVAPSAAKAAAETVSEAGNI